MTERSLNRKLAAIFFADAVGYSRLTGEDEDGTFLQINECLDLIRDSILHRNGSVIHYAGDAVLADFTTVSDALSCAVDVRSQLKARNEDIPENRQVWFRIGVNLGEVVFEDNRIFGDGVNVAARLESLADPGGICISESARSAIGSKLGLRYEFMGEQAVKNIERPVRAYRVLAAEDPDPSRVLCPYPGMVPFSAAEAAMFYGREDEISRLVMLLRKQRFLMVIGPSGSGKSSLVYAGLLPALAQSRYFEQGSWLVRSMRPGSLPANTLRQLLEVENDSAEIDNQVLDRLIEKNSPAQKLLLVVDQFEEVFTLADRDEQTLFIAQLLAIRLLPNVVLIMTFRADFYSNLMNSYLWPLDASERVEVAPLRGEALHQAIEKPAAAVGVKIENNLINQLVADAADEPGALPLLQETMSLLWDEMDNRALSLNDYQNLSRHAGIGDSGKVTGLAVAIAMKADRTLQELSISQRTIARRTFLRLIQFGEGRADTRRQLPISALHSANDKPGELEQTLEHLTENRLLTRSGGESSQPSLVDISHESLINGWTRLQEWADERREAEQIRRRLESKASEWVRLGRATGGLLSEVELPEAQHWLASADAEDLGFDATLPALVSASEEALEKLRQEKEAVRQQKLQQAEALAVEQKRRIEEQATAANRLRRTLVGLAAVLVAAIGLGGFAWVQKQEADSRRIEALQAEQNAKQLALSEASARENAEARRVEAEDARLSSIAQLLAIQVPDQQAASQDEKAALMARQAHTFAEKGSPQLKAQLDSVLRTTIGKPFFSQILRQTLTSAVAISADATRVASIHAAPDEVVLWDLTQPDIPPVVLTGFPGKPGLFPSALAFTHNDTRLIAGSPDGTILQWQLDNADLPMSELPSHDAGAWSLANSNDQRWLALGSKRSNSLVVWDMQQDNPQPLVIENPQATAIDATSEITPDKVPAIEAPGGVPVAFSPDSKTLATGNRNGIIHLWNPADLVAPVMNLSGHEGGILSLAFSHSGEQLISGGEDASIRVWNLDYPNKPPVIISSDFKASSLTPLADDSAVVAAGVGIKLWSLNNSGQPPMNLSALSVAYGVALSPDGKTLATAGGNGAGGMRLLDMTDSGQPRELKGHQKLILSVAFSPDGQLLGSGGNPADRTIRLWNWDSLNSPPRVLANQKGATNSLEFTSDNTQLLTTSWNTGAVELWDLTSDNPLSTNFTMPGAHRPWTTRFSPDGEHIVAGGHKAIFSWSRSNPDSEASVFLPTQSHMFGIDYSADGTYMAASGFGSVLYLKNLTDPDAPVVELPGHSPAGSRTLAFSPDGKLLASGGQDGTVRLWNPAAPDEPSMVLGHHNDAVTRVRFSPDGKQLASSSVDQDIRLWSLEDKTELPIVLSGFEGQIYGLDYHPDGRHLAAGGHVGENGTGIRIWDLTHPLNNSNSQQVAAMACSKVRRNMTFDEWNNFVGQELPYETTCPDLPVHPSLLRHAEQLAKAGDKDKAVALLQRAVELGVKLSTDAETQVNQWATPPPTQK